MPMRLRAILLALCATLAALLAAAAAAPSAAAPVPPPQAANAAPPAVRRESCVAEIAGPSLGAWPVEVRDTCTFRLPERAQWLAVQVRGRNEDPTVAKVEMTVSVCGPGGACLVDRSTDGLRGGPSPFELELGRDALAGKDTVTVEFRHVGLGLGAAVGQGESFDVAFQAAWR